MRKPRICLFFSDTGGGHRSATEAVAQGLKEVVNTYAPDSGVEVLVENIVEKSHPLNRYFVELYNFLLRHNQAGMKYYYWFIEAFKPNDSEVGYQLAKPYLLRFLDEVDASVIVSVHPMSNHYLARALADSGRRESTKLVTIVTDPNGDFWSGWACKDSDLTLVPNELGRERLISLGVHPERIQVTGMVVHPDFLKPPTCGADEFRVHLGLEPGRPTICLNAGWAGGGNMRAIYRALASVDRKAQVIFLCGHNRSLYERMRKEAYHSPVPTAVLPFHDRMSDLMSAVDLMVTKAGGLTSFEAVARRLPMAIDMLTTPMPQELGTARLLCDAGLAKPLEKAEDIVPIVEQLVPQDQDSRLVRPLPSVCSLDRVDAVYSISRSLLSMAGVEVEVPTTGSSALAAEIDGL